LSVGSSPVSLTASSNYTPASSPAASAITYGSSNTAAITVSGSTLTVVGAGTSNITAYQTADENGNYSAASTVVQSVTIAKATPTITVTPIGTYIYNGSAQGPNAVTKGGSTGAVTYSYVGVNGTVYSAVTRPTNAGSYTVTASVAADANYNAASSPATAFSIAKATPTLSLASSSVNYTGSAQAATVNSSVGSVSNVLYNGSSTVPIGVGSYPITADFVPIDGTNYNNLTETFVGTFSINNTVPDAPTSVVGTKGNAQVSVAFTAPTNNGGTAITTYTVTPYAGAIAGTPITQNTNPIVVTGLTNGTAYTFTVIANNALGASAASTASSAVTPIATNVSITNTETKTPSELGLTPSSVVTVDNGGTLNINATTTVSSITVASGGKLNVVAGTPLSVGTLTLTGALDGSVTSIKLDDNINASTVRLLKTIDKNKWYFMSFPYNVVVNDITKSNGDPKPTLNGEAGDLFIKYYDGAQRGTSGVGSNWKHYEGSELIANQGYIFGLSNTQDETTLSFPLKISGGVLTAETSNRNIFVAENPGTLSNNSGWNLIGQPFLSKFIANKAVGDYDIYVYNGVNYSQFTKDNIPAIIPFSAYFIQASTILAGTGISFVSSNGRQLSPSVAANELLDEVQLDFVSSTGSDYALLRMDNSMTTGYEIGRDLEKWIGTGTPKPQIYTSLGGLNYAFNALPMSSVVNLPVGIYTQTAGSTIIHAAAAKAPSLSKLLLTDHATNPETVTDLLVSDYSFFAAAGTNNSRFTISAQRITTDNNLIGSEFGETQMIINNSKLIINNLAGNTSVRIFDALGRMVVRKTDNSNSMEIKLNSRGIYTVQLQSGTTISTRKVIF
jgi:hypothetical protein